MTAQLPTDKFNSTDFIAAINSSDNSSSDSSKISQEGNSTSSCFTSEDFQKFLHEHRDALESASNDTASSSLPASSSIDQLFKTSEFFKSQQFSDLFKSQQSFSQMFQSKDSFAELFRSLDVDQKKALFSVDNMAMNAPSMSSLPTINSMSRTSSSSSSRSRHSLLFQSKDWKNLGAHVDVNYQQSKLFRDTSSSFGEESSSDEPDSIQKERQQLQPQESAKTDWGNLFNTQLQTVAPGSSRSPASTMPTSTARPAPSTLTPNHATLVPPVAKTLAPPVAPLQRTNKSPTPFVASSTKTNKIGNNSVTIPPVGKEGKKYIRNPTETDILMGRGGKSNHHPGNKRYREEITNFKITYSQLRSKEEKTDLSRHVVDYVHKYDGRFLALDKSVRPAQWYEITDAVARRKVSQALREDSDPVKRQQKRARFLERKRLKEEEAKEEQRKRQRKET